jgi:hypothetical protein
MTEREKRNFTEVTGGRECIAYFQRPDGRIQNLSILAMLRRWFPFFRLASWSSLVALLPIALSGCAGTPTLKDPPLEPNQSQNANPALQLSTRSGTPRAS